MQKAPAIIPPGFERQALGAVSSEDLGSAKWTRYALNRTRVCTISQRRNASFSCSEMPR